MAKKVVKKALPAKKPTAKSAPAKKSSAKSTTKKAAPKQPRKEVLEVHNPEVLDHTEDLATNVDDSNIIEPEIIEPDYSRDEDGDASAEPDSSLGAVAFTSLEPEKEVEASSGALTTTDPLTRYLQEVRRYPLLTREDERRLAVLYRETGDKKAAEMLVTSNLRFVVKVAAEYTKFGAKLIDLVQEGNVGLMHAVREFNPYKDVRLITYAVWWIRGYIQEYLMRQYSMVRIGTTATQRKLFYQLQRQKEELERLGPDQVVAQLSGRLGIEPDEVRNMHMRLTSRDVSLDKPVGESGDDTLGSLQKSTDQIGADEQLGKMEELHLLRDKIEDLRPDLNEREQVVLDKRLLADDPLTLQEIGEKYHITREAVRQIEARLIEKLRARLIE